MAAMNVGTLEQQHSKIASRYDVYNKLALPVRMMGAVWTEGNQNARVVTFRVLNIYYESWVLEGHLRRDGQGHPKPEVSGPGWVSFKQTMGLRVGDQLVFYRPPNGLPQPAIFVIGVKRQIRLAGATFYGHVAPAAA